MTVPEIAWLSRTEYQDINGQDYAMSNAPHTENKCELEKILFSYPFSVHVGQLLP